MDRPRGLPGHNSRLLGGRQVDIESVLVFLDAVLLLPHCFDASLRIGLGGRNPVMGGCDERV